MRGGLLRYKRTTLGLAPGLSLEQRNARREGPG